jgi:hypothetical protein
MRARWQRAHDCEMAWFKFDDMARWKIDGKLLRGDLTMRNTRR